MLPPFLAQKGKMRCCFLCLAAPFLLIGANSAKKCLFSCINCKEEQFSNTVVGYMLSYAVLGVSVKPEVAWPSAGCCAVAPGDSKKATGRKQPGGYMDKMLIANLSIES